MDSLVNHLLDIESLLFYVDQAGLELVAIFLLQPPSFGITGICHHAQLKILLEIYFLGLGRLMRWMGQWTKAPEAKLTS